MAKGPGLYTDIGKKARDLFYWEYRNHHKFSITTYSPTGVTFTTSAQKKYGLFSADVNTQIKHMNMTTDIKVDTSSILTITNTVVEAAPGLTTTMSMKIPDQSFGEIDLQYLHDYLGIHTSVNLTANPVVKFSGMIGVANKVALGTDVSFDSKTRKFTKYDVGLSYSRGVLTAAVDWGSGSGNNRLDTLNTWLYCDVNPATNFAVCVQAGYSRLSGDPHIALGTQYAINPLTNIKARINSFGMVSALIQHEWRPRSLLTIYSMVDYKDIKASPKVGLTLALKP